MSFIFLINMSGLRNVFHFGGLVIFTILLTWIGVRLIVEGMGANMIANLVAIMLYLGFCIGYVSRNSIIKRLYRIFVLIVLYIGVILFLTQDSIIEQLFFFLSILLFLFMVLGWIYPPSSVSTIVEEQTE